MRKGYLLLIFLFTVTAIHAQWAPFPLGQKSFYEYTTLQDTTLNTYFHDSIVNHGSHQTLQFDYSTSGYDGCYEALNNDPDIFQSIYRDINRPDSVIKKNDSLLLAYSLGSFPIITDSIFFLPNTVKDSSWFTSINNGNSTYNKLQFTCDSIYLGNTLGNITDSLKSFSIKAYNNSTPVNSAFDSLNIILSKNYGFKQFVSFYNNQNTEFQLAGIKSPTSQEGFQLPTFSDYFPLNAGDIIIWKKHTTYSDIMIPETTVYYKDSLTNTIVNNDSAVYHFVRTLENGISTPGTFHYYKINLEGLNVSTSIFCTSKIIGLGNYPGSGELHETSPLFTTSNSIINRQFTHNSMYYDPNTCSGIPSFDNGAFYLYNTYYGLTSYGSGSLVESEITTIEGSIIDGIQIGNVWSVGIDELSANNRVNIFPNPNNGENFTIKGKNINAIEIQNIQGQLVKKINPLNNTTKVQLESHPNGIYFVKIKFKNGNILTKKLILSQ